MLAASYRLDIRNAALDVANAWNGPPEQFEEYIRFFRRLVDATPSLSLPQCDCKQDPDEDTQLDGLEAAITLHTIHLDELTEQLAKLDDKLDRCVMVGDKVGNGLGEQLAKLAEQLAKHDGVLEGIDSRFSNMSDGMDVHVDRVRAKIAELTRFGEAQERILGHHRRELDKLATRVDLQQERIKGFACRNDDFHGRFKTIEGRLAELAKLVDDHRSTAEGCLTAHQAELKAFGAHYHATDARADNSGPPACSAPAPAACEHPKERVKVRPVCLRGGMMNTEVCDCGAIYASEWYVPQSSAAPPKPACEHPKTPRILVRIKVDDVAVTECISCKAVFIEGKWYTPEPSGKADEGS